jgi:murein DD-endopeptidase MepM/ murein hydrolase activator NlpD
MSGRSFGPHLHLETYPTGVRLGQIYHAVDPEAWLRRHGVKAMDAT